jgi:hypothetical protein
MLVGLFFVPIFRTFLRFWFILGAGHDRRQGRKDRGHAYKAVQPREVFRNFAAEVRGSRPLGDGLAKPVPLHRGLELFAQQDQRLLPTRVGTCGSADFGACANQQNSSFWIIFSNVPQRRIRQSNSLDNSWRNRGRNPSKAPQSALGGLLYISTVSCLCVT